MAFSTPATTRVNPPDTHADLLAAFQRAQADADHKSGLIKAAERKGPKAIAAAVETAAKAAKRRDSFAKKLRALGVTPMSGAASPEDSGAAP